jgi:D-lyxose ketol-isomerase
MIEVVDQVTPLHFHWKKMEDIIINRGGGYLLIQLYNSTVDELLADTDILVTIDGAIRQVQAGATVELSNGESICLPPLIYHKFWGSRKKVLVGEVSVVNEDKTDNRFYDPIGSFPIIDEDETPLYLLVSDYSRYYNPKLENNQVLVEELSN